VEAEITMTEFCPLTFV